jgi:proteasome lid subunit RPN8/RPN11
MTKPKPVWISEQAITVISEAAWGAHPKETGGILLGVYVKDRPWVTHSVHVESAEPRRNFYRLPLGVRPQVVDEMRKIDGRLGYLGEWHSHPANVGPSLKDKISIGHIAWLSKADCPYPLLIVAKRNSTGYELDITEWAGWRLRPVRVVLAGEFLA